MKRLLNNIKGFTIIELMISVAIFALMTALLLAKYGTFNQGILLTNLAYDVALTIRNSQSYGLNVKSAPTGGRTFSDEYNFPYGVYFQSGTNTFTFFSDANSNGMYDEGEEISHSTMKSGALISDVCVGTEDSCPPGVVNKIAVTFRRPNPDAIIKTDSGSTATYTKISLKATDGSRRSVVVRSTGQIAVEN